MNATRRNAAVNKFGPVSDTNTLADIKTALENSDKAYTTEEIDEILEKIAAGETDSGVNGDGEKGANENQARSVNHDYEEWAVDAQFEQKEVNGEKKYVFKDFVKLRKLRELVRITPERMDELNSQSRSTMVRLYPQQKKDQK